MILIAARHGALWIAQANRANDEALLVGNRVISYLYFTRIECMAIGGLFAWIAFAKKRALQNFLHSRATQAVVYALTAWLLVTDSFKPIFHCGLYSVLFGVLIFNVATNERSFIRFPGRTFELLGNISFAIYMLHELAIQLVIASGWTSNAALYGASMVPTIAAASACYLWFERPFLRLKPYPPTAASSRIRATRRSRTASRPEEAAHDAPAAWEGIRTKSSLQVSFRCISASKRDESSSETPSGPFEKGLRVI